MNINITNNITISITINIAVNITINITITFLLSIFLAINGVQLNTYRNSALFLEGVWGEKEFRLHAVVPEPLTIQVWFLVHKIF